MVSAKLPGQQLRIQHTEFCSRWRNSLLSSKRTELQGNLRQASRQINKDQIIPKNELTSLDLSEAVILDFKDVTNTT